jgi:crotonobetainyl-CoA:carnitine CoA-transferase CaiB-like acyl-CoA transferase
VIVMGGEAARLFADQGADVLKIESRAFPDGARGPVPMSPSFAVGHRNLKSVGLDLRNPAGAALFRRLAAEADVVLNNFKPGTMERLGLGYDALSTVNPGLVMVSCSAFGDSGPWRNWMGYGPLVRAASGLASLWRYEDEPARFGDTGLTYPDHFAARVVNAAALAGLVRREKTGVGCHVRCSQAETVLMVLGEHLLAESAGRPLTVPDAPWGVFPCAGDDEWCVVTVQGDEAWKRLGVALDDPKFTSRASLATAEGRCEARAEIDAWLGEWTRRHGPQEAAELLQAAGVAAGPMQRGVDLLQDPQLVLRRQFRTMRQPELPEPLIVENGATIFASGLEPPHRPAPLMGAHTREACASWLGLNETELDELFACGALEHRA